MSLKPHDFLKARFFVKLILARVEHRAIGAQTPMGCVPIIQCVEKSLKTEVIIIHEESNINIV